VLLLFFSNTGPSLSEVDPMKVFWHWVGDEEHWRTHSRVYFRFQYSEDRDGTLPDPVMPLFGLQGSMRSMPGGALLLNLTPYLSWTTGSHLTCDIPDGVLHNVAPGRYEVEIVATESGANPRTLLVGQVELRKSVHR
jgi:hypothetical protein